MGVDALAAWSLRVMFTIVGLPITVTRPAPDDAPVETTGIWVAPVDKGLAGEPFYRPTPERVLAIPHDETLSTLPIGSVIDAPEDLDGDIQEWRVSDLERPSAADHWRAILVPADSQGTVTA